MLDYKLLYEDLLEEISCIYEEIVYKHIDAMEDDDFSSCEIYNFACEKFLHILNYASFKRAKLNYIKKGENENGK